MAGVHRRKKIERLRTPNLPQYDPVRPHPQSVFDKVAHCDLAIALHIGRARFQPNDVRLHQLQFGGILNGNHPLATIDVAGNGVQHRGLAGAGSTGNQDVHPDPAGDVQ